MVRQPRIGHHHHPKKARRLCGKSTWQTSSDIILGWRGQKGSVSGIDRGMMEVVGVREEIILVSTATDTCGS